MTAAMDPFSGKGAGGAWELRELEEFGAEGAWGKAMIELLHPRTLAPHSPTRNGSQMHAALLVHVLNGTFTGACE